MFVGFLTTFLIQHVIGLDGMPRRVYEYANVGHLAAVQRDLDGRLVHPRRWRARDDRERRAQPQGGRPGGPDPWRANTLEWFTTSPPPANNFDIVPLVRSAEPMKDIRREIERRSRRAPARARPVPTGATQVGV